MPLAELLRAAAGDTHPPGHFLVLRAWQTAFGDSIPAQRGLSAVCGTLSMVVIFAVVAELGRWCGGPAPLAGASWPPPAPRSTPFT